GFTDKNGEPAPRGILWTVKEDEPDVARVNELIRETHDALLQKGVTAESGNIEQFKASVLDTVSLFGTIFNLTAWLIALVGAVGLLTTLSMSVFERQKEIGVMRSVGASSGTIISQFLT